MSCHHRHCGFVFRPTVEVILVSLVVSFKLVVRCSVLFQNISFLILALVPSFEVDRRVAFCCVLVPTDDPVLRCLCGVRRKWFLISIIITMVDD
jgi:hypothetical protein